MLTSLSIILAQSTPDISSVPAEFVKYFMIMCAFLGGLYVAHRKGKAASGQRDEPVHVHQPLTVRRETEYAPKAETDKELENLNSKIEAMARENLRAHTATAAQITSLIQSGSQRGEDILKAIHQSRDAVTAAMLGEVKALHERINPLAERVAAHESAISWIKERLAAIWDHIGKVIQGNESAHSGINKRLDDAIRLAGDSKKK